MTRIKFFSVALLCLWLFGCGGAGGGGAADSAPDIAAVAPPPPARLVAFVGDSITSQWDTAACVPNSINAGVSGNFTWQMAERFQADVLDKNPNVVVILGGTNDVAGGAFNAIVGTDAVRDMAQMAKAAGIVPIIGTIPPNSDVPTTWGWGPAIVFEWNARVQSMARINGFQMVDYYPLFLNLDGTQNMDLYDNPSHPNAAGRALMCAEIRKVLATI